MILKSRVQFCWLTNCKLLKHKAAMSAVSLFSTAQTAAVYSLTGPWAVGGDGKDGAHPDVQLHQQLVCHLKPPGLVGQPQNRHW